jgi:hypothetical protein
MGRDDIGCDQLVAGERVVDALDSEEGALWKSPPATQN